MKHLKEYQIRATDKQNRFVLMLTSRRITAPIAELWFRATVRDLQTAGHSDLNFNLSERINWWDVEV